jgi:hypothetical protein
MYLEFLGTTITIETSMSSEVSTYAHTNSEKYIYWLTTHVKPARTWVQIYSFNQLFLHLLLQNIAHKDIHCLFTAPFIDRL